MSAGLPGLGLGGLFFIFSALLAPFPELWRTLRGRSGLTAWRTIGRQFGQAVAMVAAIDLTLRFAYVALSATGLGNPPPADSGTVLPLTLIGITTALLLMVMAGAKLAEMVDRLRVPGIPRVPESLPRPTPLRALAIGSASAVAWLAILAVGASKLTPLSEPRGDRTVEPRAEVVRQSASRSAEGPGPPVSESRGGAATAAPTEAGGRPLAADAGQQVQSTDVDGPVPQIPVKAAPQVAAPSPAPEAASPPEQSPAAVPHTAIPAAAADEHPSGPPSAPSPNPAGPAAAGPPEGSPAPEQAGPPQETGPPKETGPPQQAAPGSRH